MLRGDPISRDGALWVDELIGASVRDARTAPTLGVVASVEANPASDLLVLDSRRAHPHALRRRAPSSTATVTVELPEGLL